MFTLRLKEGTSRLDKIGFDEIVGLSDIFKECLGPIKTEVSNRIYWDDSLDFESITYKACSGFMPYSNNLGGLMLSKIIPECEKDSFSFLEFGECENTDENDYCFTNGCECDNDGSLSAALNIMFKIEELDLENDEIKVYYCVYGGNNDAPYFRCKHMPTLFEGDFQVKARYLKRALKRACKEVLDFIE